MTAKEVFELRKNGFVEEAYDACRKLYATDKGSYASLAMFWTASDILRKRLNDGQRDEALKIFRAIERMLPNVPDDKGWVKSTFNRCESLIRNEVGSEPIADTRNGEHITMGVWGEELAAAYLRDKGYLIMERDWHSGHRDIDIIARHDDCLVFVEVKTRRNNDIIEPEMAVGYKKQRNLRLSINHYIKFKHFDGPYRFDVITVVGSPMTEPVITHIENFQLLPG